MTVKHPTILWAQRSENIYLSIEVEDMNVEELQFSDDKFIFKGKHGADVYEVDLTLFDKLKGNERRQIATKRRLEFVVPKEKAEWWPRLLKDKVKIPWLKVDFDKWKDEDETNEESDFNFGNMDFGNFGLPGGGAPPGLGDLDLDDEDDDGGMEPLEDVEDEDKGKDYDGEGAKDMVTNGSTKASE